MPENPTVVFDCRWLGIGGPGKATELLLRGMAEAPPPGRWILWGPEPLISAVAWPGVDIRPFGADPRLLLGQRHAFAVPKGDFYVFMHQQRPLRSVPAVTVVHDTIPLHGPMRLQRELKRLFLRWVVRNSRLLITISDYSRACIVDELGAPPERLAQVRFPFDDAFAERVLARRKTAATEDVALFIGGFLPHKNLPRLLAAFGDTDFCRRGGRLVLVGASATQADGMLERLDDRQRRFVTVRHACSQAEMDHLYATSRLLVQPSLEEGFGLPVWEAMCCGLPVCVSDGGALPEITRGFADPFPARSVPAMAAAIDACAERARHLDPGAAAAQAQVLRERSPTVAEFGARFAALVLERAVW